MEAVSRVTEISRNEIRSPLPIYRERHVASGIAGSVNCPHGAALQGLSAIVS
jgi:hypothetical protein